MVLRYVKKIAAFFVMEIRRYHGILNNEVSYRRGITSKFEYRLLKKYLKKSHDFGTRGFYQNYPALDISGSRPCIGRYHTYDLASILKPNFDVLDIGGNVGFFSLHISAEVKTITIVEYNNVCAEIFEIVRSKEHIDNVSMHIGDFKTWNRDDSLRYDLVLSLAIHKWIGMDIQSYLARLHRLLNPNGLLLIESHHQADKTHLQNEVENATEIFEIIRTGLSDDNGGKTRLFYLLRARVTR